MLGSLEAVAKCTDEADDFVFEVMFSLRVPVHHSNVAAVKSCTVKARFLVREEEQVWTFGSFSRSSGVFKSYIM